MTEIRAAHDSLRRLADEQHARNAALLQQTPTLGASARSEVLPLAIDLNAPGGIAKQFASVRQIEITGGVQSFWGRNVKLDRVDIRDPRLWFEVLPDGNHNFPKWKTGPKRRFEIVRMVRGSAGMVDSPRQSSGTRPYPTAESPARSTG